MEAANEKVRVARLSVYSNSALVAMKLVVGVMMGSVGVISEAIHSGVDLVASFIAVYSVKMSARPADKEHRYGHGKYENFSGLVEGALIFVAALIVLYEATHRLLTHASVELVWFGMVVMAVSVVVNILVSRKLMEVARRTDSLALEADAYHLKTDVWTSLGVFVALGLIIVTGYNEIDALIAIGVGAMIIRAAYDISRRSTHGLLDTSLPDEEITVIEKIMNEHGDQFVDFHRLRARKTGAERQIDLHLTVPTSLSVKDSHDLAEHLEQEIKARMPNSVIVIHIEPCDQECEKCRIRGTHGVFRG